jgi:hypothetical protein
MALPLDQVDTSVIDQLVVLKRERAEVASRLERMTAEGSSVSPTVFHRVQADYQSRISALDDRAAPLKDNARSEFVKLRRLLEQVNGERETALQDQEELEFRHRLGEFDDAGYRSQATDVAKRITGLDRDLAAVSAVREQFVGAFESEDELNQAPALLAAAPAPVAAPVAPPIVEEPMAETPVSETPVAEIPMVTMVATDEPPVAAEPIDVAPPAPAKSAPTLVSTGATDAGSTRVLSRAPTPAPPPLGDARAASGPTVILPEAVEAAEAASPGTPTGGTVIVTFGRLVPLDNTGTSEFSVQPFTTIGRTRQNNVQLDSGSVSRRHAQISLTENGYVVRDLGSENGTYVNGDRITEHPLADGDHVQFGALRFSFHGK